MSDDAVLDQIVITRKITDDGSDVLVTVDQTEGIEVLTACGMIMYAADHILHPPEDDDVD